MTPNDTLRLFVLMRLQRALPRMIDDHREAALASYDCHERLAMRDDLFFRVVQPFVLAELLRGLQVAVERSLIMTPIRSNRSRRTPEYLIDALALHLRGVHQLGAALQGGLPALLEDDAFPEGVDLSEVPELRALLSEPSETFEPPLDQLPDEIRGDLVKENLQKDLGRVLQLILSVNILTFKIAADEEARTAIRSWILAFPQKLARDYVTPSNPISVLIYDSSTVLSTMMNECTESLLKIDAIRSIFER